MDEAMTKPRLLETLLARRAAWDATLARVPPERMTEPGVAGPWSVKDIITHLTYYERWIADRLHEALRGEVYRPGELDRLPFDERNDRIYQQRRAQPLAEALTESHAAFERLVAGVEAHTEAYLVEPQQFEGAPAPVIIWQFLRSEVYDHYGRHAPAIVAWLAAPDRGQEGAPYGALGGAAAP
jgi:hypothetical protein